jgi:hypothetical protein
MFWFIKNDKKLIPNWLRLFHQEILIGENKCR